MEWSGAVSLHRAPHRARSLSSARRQPAQLKQCSAGHHTCEPCLMMSYNIQRYFLVETVHFSVQNIVVSMVKQVAKHGLHVCRRFCLSLGCAIPSRAPHLSIWISTASIHTAPLFSIYSSKFLYLNIYCIYLHCVYVYLYHYPPCLGHLWPPSCNL